LECCHILVFSLDNFALIQKLIHDDFATIQYWYFCFKRPFPYHKMNLCQSTIVNIWPKVSIHGHYLLQRGNWINVFDWQVGEERTNLVFLFINNPFPSSGVLFFLAMIQRFIVHCYSLEDCYYCHWLPYKLPISTWTSFSRLKKKIETMFNASKDKSNIIVRGYYDPDN
jgi:hypothetical protein